jgi:hypothetical protein
LFTFPLDDSTNPSQASIFVKMSAQKCHLFLDI